MISINIRLFQVHHKKHETFIDNSPIIIYINSIYIRLVFKLKDIYKPELHLKQ